MDAQSLHRQNLDARRRHEDDVLEVGAVPGEPSTAMTMFSTSTASSSAITSGASTTSPRL
jgi:hypothetical protein